MNTHILVAERSPTIRRVVASTLRERGLRCELALDAEDAIVRARHRAPDLLLIDQTLNERGGLALLRRLRAIANLAEVPAVLLAARPADIDDATSHELGLDVIQKPFAPEALLAVALHSLKREAASTTAVDQLAPTPIAEEPEASLMESCARARAVLARELCGPLAELTGGVDAENVEAVLARHLSDHALSLMLDDLRGAATDQDLGASLTVRLEDVALGEVLQMLQHERQTGVLSLGDGSMRAHINLRQGMVDLATARGVSADLRIGRYLIEDGAIDARELSELLARRGGSGHLLGSLLVKLGYVTTEDVRGALVRQTSEIIYETLRWPTGSCSFTRFARRPEAEQAGLGLPVGAILMEGLRRVDEWRLIEEQLPAFDVRLRPSGDALAGIGPDALSADDRAVLDAIGSESSVGDVVRTVGHAAFDTCKILFRLVTAGLVRRI